MRHCWKSVLVHFERPQSGIFSCKEAKTQGSIRGRLQRTFPNYIGNVSLSVLNSLQTRSKPIFPRSEECDPPNPRGMNYEVKKNSEGISLPSSLSELSPKTHSPVKGQTTSTEKVSEDDIGLHYATAKKGRVTFQSSSTLPRHFPQHRAVRMGLKHKQKFGCISSSQLFVTTYLTNQQKDLFTSTADSFSKSDLFSGNHVIVLLSLRSGYPKRIDITKIIFNIEGSSCVLLLTRALGTSKLSWLTVVLRVGMSSN